MAEFRCEKCGARKEVRCKPKKCGECGGTDCMVKVEAAPVEKKTGGCGCGCKRK